MAMRWVGMGVFGVLALTAVVAACGGDSSDLPGDCTTLNTCCSQLTNATEKAECLQAVAAQDTEECAEAQNTFTTTRGPSGATLCTVASSTTTTPTTATTGCAGLMVCCSQLSGANATSCASEASTGIDTACETGLSFFVSQNLCKVGSTTSTGPTTVTGTGCAGLTSCCTQLSGNDNTECLAQVMASQDDDAFCGTYLTMYEGEGLCGNTKASADAGTTAGGCSALQTCCTALPEVDQSACQDVVTMGNASLCSDELESYQASEACP